MPQNFPHQKLRARTLQMVQKGPKFPHCWVETQLFPHCYVGKELTRAPCHKRLLLQLGRLASGFSSFVKEPVCLPRYPLGIPRITLQHAVRIGLAQQSNSNPLLTLKKYSSDHVRCSTARQQSRASSSDHVRCSTARPAAKSTTYFTRYMCTVVGHWLWGTHTG